MRKAINYLGWIAVFCTIICLVLYLISTYDFRYLNTFKDYFTFQWFMIITMIIWSIKVYSWKETSRNVIYSLCFLLIAVGTACFMYLGIK